MARQGRGGRLYRGVFRLLEGIGVKNARTRWESQSPFLQRAIPPLVIAALVILVIAAVPRSGHGGDRPARNRLRAVRHAATLARWALPLTVLAFAVAYPLLIQQSSYQRFLFQVPIFNNFPSIDTMAAMAIFAMMAVGLNIVVGYAGLLDLGYVAFYALGAYTAAWLLRRVAVHVGREADRRQHRGRRRPGARRDPHLDLGRPARCRDCHRGGRDTHRPADAATTRRLPRDRDPGIRGDRR